MHFWSILILDVHKMFRKWAICFTNNYYQISMQMLANRKCIFVYQFDQKFKNLIWQFHLLKNILFKECFSLIFHCKYIILFGYWKIMENASKLNSISWIHFLECVVSYQNFTLVYKNYFGKCNFTLRHYDTIYCAMKLFQSMLSQRFKK